MFYRIAVLLLSLSKITCKVITNKQIKPHKNGMNHFIVEYDLIFTQTLAMWNSVQGIVAQLVLTNDKCEKQL